MKRANERTDASWPLLLLLLLLLLLMKERDASPWHYRHSRMSSVHHQRDNGTFSSQEKEEEEEKKRKESMRRAPDVWNDGIIIIKETTSTRKKMGTAECLHVLKAPSLLIFLFFLLCLSVALCIVTCSLFRRRKGTTGPCVLCWSDCPFESRITGKHTAVTQRALVCAL